MCQIKSFIYEYLVGGTCDTNKTTDCWSQEYVVFVRIHIGNKKV